MFKQRTNDYEKNLTAVKSIMEGNKRHFTPLLEPCPGLDIILAEMFVLWLGLTVNDVDFTTDMKDWSEKDCRNVGKSMATFMRMVQNGELTIDAWRKNYPPLDALFQVEGFEGE